jgi:biopolymer transport protein ExbD
MASMIDIVFLLLIFFMCTSSFRKQEMEMQTLLPRLESGEKGEAGDFTPIRIRLRSVADGVLVTLRVMGRREEAVGTFDALVEKLKQRRAIADVSVIIEGQGTVMLGHMVSALDACHKADLRRVAFSAKGVEP